MHDPKKLSSITTVVDLGPDPRGLCAVCDKPSTARCPRCLTTWYCSPEHRGRDLVRHTELCVEYEKRLSDNQRVAQHLVMTNKVICVVLPNSRWISCGNVGVFYVDPTTGDRYGLTSAEIVDGGLLKNALNQLLPKVMVGLSREDYSDTMMADADYLAHNTTGRPVFCATWARVDDRADVTRNLEQVHINRRLGVVVMCRNGNAIIKVDKDFPELVADEEVIKAGIESTRKQGSDWVRISSDGVLDYVQHHRGQPEWLYPGVGQDDGLCGAVQGPFRVPRMFFDLVKV
jgi:hypothetical protein